MPTNAKRGNLFLLAMGTTFDASTYTTVAALRATGLTFNKAVVDITNKDASGWSEILPGGGVKSASISASGIYSNGTGQDLLISAFNANTHWTAKISDEDGATFTGTWNVDSLAFSGDHNVEQTFEITLSSTGPVTFTPGS